LILHSEFIILHFPPMPNRLAHESSPYLLQHQNNPVDWFPWGDDAFTKAKIEQKPIFLSIGYSACHWCHVMEHESFENPAIAALMNANFVNIKVDREERPDLDAIYMQAVQLMTRRGGWPMSVFLTPDARPFYGGTYWPPIGRMGMPGFDQILNAVHDAWTNRREQALEQATELTGYLHAAAERETPISELDLRVMYAAGAAHERNFDATHGGFGGAPKFPHSMDLRLLLRLQSRAPRPALLRMITLTLDKMAGGGMYDQLGGGFHRYSVDERWLVPHFEKMLYDNALLASAYIEAFQLTGDADYARVVRETCDYVLRELTDAAGGFRSTEDADSEGEEGKFYVWTHDELQAVLGVDAARVFAAAYDVNARGNFEGHSILNRPRPWTTVAAELGISVADLEQQLAASREKLFAVREQRIRPGLDDKVLVSWNGLMIEALALAGAVLDEPRYTVAARKCAEFLWRELRDANGRLLHTWRGGKAKLAAYLDDYAALANGLVTLYEADGDSAQIQRAVELCERMLADFADPEGGFFFTAAGHEQLIARHKDLQDNAVPSGNSLAACALVRLAKLTGRANFFDAAAATIRSAAGLLEQYPSAAAQMLLALDLQLGPTPELALIVAPGSEDAAAAKSVVESHAAMRAVKKTWLPRRVLAIRASDAPLEPTDPLAPLFAGKLEQPTSTGSADLPKLYICEGFACQAPVTGAAAIKESLEKLH